MQYDPDITLPPKGLYRVDEVANFLKVTPRHVYYMVDARKLKAIRVGRSLRIRGSSLGEFMEENEA